MSTTNSSTMTDNSTMVDSSTMIYNSIIARTDDSVASDDHVNPDDHVAPNDDMKSNKIPSYQLADPVSRNSDLDLDYITIPKDKLYNNVSTASVQGLDCES